MFARVSTYRTADSDKLLKGFESVTSPLERMDGFSQALFLVDRAGGKAMSITVWESEEALKASETMADVLRKEGAEAGRGSIDSVERYEIGLMAGSAMSRTG